MRKRLLTILFVFLPLLSQAQNMESPLSEPPVHVDLPVMDLPFNSSRYFPDYFSMRQSLAFSTDFYESMHWWLGGPPEEQHSLRSVLSIVAFDLVVDYVPLGNAWMHEEWHRSVMSHRGIGSFNDVNTFPFGASLIAVSHVDDADLVRLKRDHPADQVRLSAAGMESQVAQNLLVEKHHFFEQLKSNDQFLLWLNAVNVSGYMSLCASGAADSSTDRQNEDDGRDLSKRDFTGLDCTAWAYDLFRPDEPYTARGTHPSGVGIDRYIRFSDLNKNEQDFLHNQAAFSFLNFADPFLFGFDGFKGRWDGEEFLWNFKLNHFLTSFGATLDSILFLKTPKNKFLLTWHHGMTDTRYFPGISAEWLEAALPWDRWSLTSGLTLWSQPKNQRIEETQSETLLDGMMQLNYKHSSKMASYLGLEAKTPGWLAGNVDLEKNVSLWAGLKLGVF